MNTGVKLTKMFWIILAIISFITVCSGNDYDCDKYCNKDCSEYFRGSEFSPCVSANVHCTCGLNPTAKTILIIISLAITITVCGLCCKHCCRSKTSPGRFYPPIVSNIDPTSFGSQTPIPFTPTPMPYNPSANPYYNPPVVPTMPSAPPPNLMQSGGFIDPPPSYGQSMEAEPPNYNYTSKYSTYK